jgi:formate dehydrogenase subunit gamma
MSPPKTSTAESRHELVRFSLAVRVIHAATAAIMVICIATAAILYNGSLAVLFGDRYIVEQLHVWSGFALPVPLIAGLASRTYRLDLQRLNRFSSLDWQWLRSRSRRDGDIPVGKFNAGQKLNGALSTGAIGGLLASGTVMYFTNVFRLSWRSGGTFVHDWFALALGLLVVGHIFYAVRDRDAMRSMRTGRVPLHWARREHGAWAKEMAGPAPPLERIDQSK